MIKGERKEWDKEGRNEGRVGGSIVENRR